MSYVVVDDGPVEFLEDDPQLWQQNWQSIVAAFQHRQEFINGEPFSIRYYGPGASSLEGFDTGEVVEIAGVEHVMVGRNIIADSLLQVWWLTYFMQEDSRWCDVTGDPYSGATLADPHFSDGATFFSETTNWGACFEELRAVLAELRYKSELESSTYYETLSWVHNGGAGVRRTFDLPLAWNCRIPDSRTWTYDYIYIANMYPPATVAYGEPLSEVEFELDPFPSSTLAVGGWRDNDLFMPPEPDTDRLTPEHHFYWTSNWNYAVCPPTWISTWEPPYASRDWDAQIGVPRLDQQALYRSSFRKHFKVGAGYGLEAGSFTLNVKISARNIYHYANNSRVIPISIRVGDIDPGDYAPPWYEWPGFANVSNLLAATTQVGPSRYSDWQVLYSHQLVLPAPATDRYIAIDIDGTDVPYLPEVRSRSLVLDNDPYGRMIGNYTAEFMSSVYELSYAIWIAPGS